MARYQFGAAEEDDILEIQGVEYHMMPIGMRIIRRFLTVNESVRKLNADGQEPTPEQAEEMLNIATELVVSAVRQEERGKMAEHIEDSIPPTLLAQIAMAITNSMSDMDPTPPPSSSDGSSEVGPSSTEPAPPAALTPSI